MWVMLNHELVTECLQHEEPELRRDLGEALEVFLEDPFDPPHPLVSVSLLRGSRRADTYRAQFPYGWNMTFRRTPRPPIMSVITVDSMLKLLSD